MLVEGSHSEHLGDGTTAAGRVSRRPVTLWVSLILILVPWLILLWRQGEVSRLGEELKRERAETRTLEQRAVEAEEQSLFFGAQLDELAKRLEEAKQSPSPLAETVAQELKKLGSKLSSLVELVGGIKAGDGGDALTTELAGVRTLLQEIKTLVAGKKSEASDSDPSDALKVEVGKLQQQLAKAASSVESLTAAVTSRDEKLDAGLESVTQELASQRQRQVELAAQLETLRALVAGLENVSRVEHPKPENGGLPALPMEARVERVQDGAIILSKGAADGVVVGREFEITRNGLPVGRVRVVKLWPGQPRLEHLAGCAVLDTTSGGSVQVGDRAKSVDAKESGPETSGPAKDGPAKDGPAKDGPEKDAKAKTDGGNSLPDKASPPTAQQATPASSAQDNEPVLGPKKPPPPPARPKE